MVVAALIFSLILMSFVGGYITRIITEGRNVDGTLRIVKDPLDGTVAMQLESPQGIDEFALNDQVRLSVRYVRFE